MALEPCWITVPCYLNSSCSTARYFCNGGELELAQGSGSTAIVAGMQLHIFGQAGEARPWSGETFAHLCQEAAAGGLSLTKALPLERYFRDVRVGLMQPPSGDTALEIIGQHAVEVEGGTRVT